MLVDRNNSIEKWRQVVFSDCIQAKSLSLENISSNY